MSRRRTQGLRFAERRLRLRQLLRPLFVEAVNVPLSDNDFVKRVKDNADSADAKIVVYCANEDCQSSAKAAETLESAGFTYVCDFEAGAEGWREGERKLANA